jgi:prephenate dehydratase
MRRQTKLVVQGFPGSFHDEAARQYFGNNRIELIPAKSFNELALELSKDHSINYAVMAIENSIAGSILQNYRLLREYGFWISGEVYLRISHNLMALPGQKIEDIKEVKSHPMALYQCMDFLNQHKQISLVEAEDTALMAQEIAEQNLRGVAAIGSKLAAQLYGLEILAPEIETSKVNYTRFIIISRDGEYTSLGNADKASIYLQVSHEKGSLLKVLEKIAHYNINISKLQSFPVLGKMNEYYFHLDLEFDHMSQYENCLEELKEVSSGLNELGIYKKAIIYDHQAVS